MDYHVLVLAMSTIPLAILGKGGSRGTQYRLKDHGKLIGETYWGLGQLEAIPHFIRSTQGTITHVVIVETPETKKPIAFEDHDIDAFAAFKSIRRLYDGKRLDLTGLNGTISHVEFFKRRMAWEGFHPTYIDTEIDVELPETGLEELQRAIRRLYSECVSSDGDWKLWMETHGGFREISMAMFGLMQMLAAPDEQELATYSSHNQNVVSMIKRLSDGRDTVPVTGVYTVEYEPGRKEPQPILDRTMFYKTFTRPAVTAYMNYGQYAQMTLRSDASDESGNILPYAFVSYCRMDAPKERYAFLGVMKREGFRYWYDDSIELHQYWARELRNANGASVLLVALITENYYSSYQCLKELQQAIEDNKPILLASLDGTPLDGSHRFGRNCDITAQGDGESITISRAKIDGLVERQQINLQNLLIDGIFQDKALAARLQKLGSENETFGRIMASRAIGG